MAADTHDKCILIIDEDPNNRYMAHTTFGQEGYLVIDSETAEEGLVLFEHHRPDAILLDVNLPGMNGLQVCKEIRQYAHGKTVPILITTSLDDIDLIDRCYQVGATDFIVKPINWLILNHRIRHVIRAQQAEAQVQHLVYYDDITGLPNRLSFKEYVDPNINHALRNQHRLAILCIEINNFKRINNTFEHTAGDFLAKKVSERLIACLRKNDGINSSADYINKSVARFSTEKFAVLLKDNINFDHVSRVAQRILTILQKPVWFRDCEIVFNTSVGIALYPADGKAPSELIKNAETATYHAKELGKNQFQYYDNAMNKRTVDKLTLERDLQKAVKNNEFFLLYQPKLDLITNTIVGVEALLRWQHPERGLIGPDKFISIAETSGLINTIGEWVLDKACQQIQQWHQLGFGSLQCSINIAAQQFVDHHLYDVINQAIQTHQIPPHCLEIEITEGAIVKSSKEDIDIMLRLKSLGIKLSVDDFGTGYSSLRYLSQFPLDAIKIDRSFVMNIPDKPTDAMIVQAIIGLARGLKLTTIAEGVETKEQLSFLQQQQCDQIQGYLISRPVSADDIVKLIR